MNIKTFIITSIAISISMMANSQERIVQNRPYTDLRPFHLGIAIGTHVQDLELMNVGPQTINNENRTVTKQIISTDQNRWDMGFNVGVYGEFRINEFLQLRIAPTMYFGSRHIVFHNSSTEKATEEQQDMKTVYIATPIDLIFAAPRFNNHRPYILGGITPAINLSGKDKDYIKLKRYDTFAEIGLGCDFYLPFFKVRPELKFMYSLMNSLDKDHIKRIEDKSMLPYANSISEAHSKMIVLTFYFE
ncbi:MAG: PorT family protein [Prevotella sp.]|nr:PorT family protein [Prevotella sp.]